MFENEHRANTIADFYRTLLLREPDLEGLTNYYLSKHSLEEIHYLISVSDERHRVVKTKIDKNMDVDGVYGYILLGSAPKKEDSQRITESNITHILDLSTAEYEYGEEDFTACARIPIPENVMFSMEDVKKALTFISDFNSKRKEGENILVCCDTGDIVSAGIVRLWLVAEGFDDESAIVYIKSCRATSRPEKNLFGPWHFEAIQEVLGKESTDG